MVVQHTCIQFGFVYKLWPALYSSYILDDQQKILFIDGIYKRNTVVTYMLMISSKCLNKTLGLET